MDEEKYRDIDENPRSLYWMVTNEPEWACSRIRQCEQLESQVMTQKKAEAVCRNITDKMRMNMVAEMHGKFTPEQLRAIAYLMEEER